MTLKRDPAIWIAIATTVLTLVATFVPWFHGVDHLMQALLVAIWALATAWKTQPIAPAIVTGVIVALFDLLSRLGFHLTDVQVGAVNSLAVLVFAVMTIRPQVTPVDDPDPNFVQGRVVLADVPVKHRR